MGAPDNADAAEAKRRSDILQAFQAEWEARSRRTQPARRAVVEEALRGYYEAVGFLGPLRGIVWTDSFASFGGAVSAVSRDYCWLLLHRALDNFYPGDSPAWPCLKESLPEGSIITGYANDEDFDPDEDEEDDEQGDRVFYEDDEDPEREGQWWRTISVGKTTLLPHCYAPHHWARQEAALENGELRPRAPASWALQALRECAAFFPGRGVAVCCDFPEEIQVETDPGLRGEFIKLRFRDGTTQHHSTWGRITGFREWDELRQWPTMSFATVLKQRGPFLPPLLDRLGAQAVAEKNSVTAILEVKEREVRRRLIEALPAIDFFLKCGEDKIPTRLLDKDEADTLWNISLPDEEDYRVVVVKNSTPEPDGSFKRYFLRVPPDMRKVREAVAWTFGLAADEYNPAQQT